MNSKQQWTGRVNSDGSLAIPPELAAKFGLRPGVQIVYEESPNEFHVLRPASHLAKIYVEPTDLCNLECRTCARNVWEEPMGMMSQATFERLLASIQQIDPLPTVFFGGSTKGNGLGTTSNRTGAGIVQPVNGFITLIENALFGAGIVIQGVITVHVVFSDIENTGHISLQTVSGFQLKAG